MIPSSIDDDKSVGPHADLVLPKEEETPSLKTVVEPEAVLQVSKKFKLIVGTITGGLLLFIYTYMVFHMMTPLGASINENLVPTWKSIITTIGGLISAVMVAVFAATPSDKPMFEGEKMPYAVLITLFATIWFIVGIFTFLFGTLQPTAAGAGKFKETVSYLGLNWLATAVAGTYAFLGLNPSQPDENE